MRVLLINPQSQGVGYYRSQIVADALNRVDGVEATYIPEFWDQGGKHIYNWFEAEIKQFDLIHCGYSDNQSVVETLVQAREYADIPLITDIDDDILNVDPTNPAYRAYHPGTKGRRVARLHLRISDAVTATTRPLAGVLRQDCRQLYVLPNCHQLGDWDYPVAPDRDQDPHIRLFFAGNIGRKPDIDLIQGPLEWAMERYHQLRPIFMTCIPDWAMQWMQSADDPKANRAFGVRRSTPSTYRAILRWLRPDILVSPLVDTTFNHSKSQIKAYDAAASGAAFLTSDCPCYEEVEGCIKVDGDLQWKESLAQLIEDAQLRQRLVGQGTAWLDKWLIDKHIDRWVTCYREVLAGGRVRSLDEIIRPEASQGAG